MMTPTATPSASSTDTTTSFLMSLSPRTANSLCLRHGITPSDSGTSTPATLLAALLATPPMSCPSASVPTTDKLSPVPVTGQSSSGTLLVNASMTSRRMVTLSGGFRYTSSFNRDKRVLFSGFPASASAPTLPTPLSSLPVGTRL